MATKSLVITLMLPHRTLAVSSIYSMTKRNFHQGTINNFEFSKISELKKRREFYGKQLVGYSMEQMYSVVSDVENYYQFVPFCKKSMVYNKKDGFLTADLVIGFPPLSEKYTSNVTMTRPSLVRAECNDGRLFSYLLNHWKFSPGVKDIPQSCVIEFAVSFQFKSAIHSQLANFFFDQLVVQMEAAFVDEAEERYGKPAIKSHVLEATSRVI
ncbi:coenzyme Q-binding protein COQ10, mitochondrial [Chironomus tepperi]|uniref:coenzyme Q-binding protein COQ10, mitochondrial n=1 Tax=Chironomus tepperi TaxID=113505 RepID=UPI00391FB388